MPPGPPMSPARSDSPTPGAVVTVSLAAWLVALPAALVKTARYSVPLSTSAVAGVVKLALVAPAIGAHVLPALPLFSHCTVGVGVPVADAVNVAVVGMTTLASAGCCVMLGAVRVGPPFSGGGGASALPPQAARARAIAATAMRRSIAAPARNEVEWSKA